MISTVIPVHIRSDLDKNFLFRALTSLNSQELKPLEVILSVDKCPDFLIFQKEILQAFPGLNLLFIEHPNSLGISKNSNMGIYKASGDFIHVLHQDDWLFDSDIYSLLSATLRNTNRQFLLLSGMRLNRIYTPRFDLTALVGNNEVGGPTGVIFPNFGDLWFDENLVMLLDVDFVHNLINKFGKPKVIDRVCVEYGVSGDQAQNLVTSLGFIGELAYIFKKLNLARSRVMITALFRLDAKIIFAVSDTLLKLPSNPILSTLLNVVRFCAGQKLRTRRNSIKD